MWSSNQTKARPGGYEGRKEKEMARYQIVYTKRGFPLTQWTNEKEDASKKANRLRQAGYTVHVWEHTESGAKKTTI